MGNPAGGNAVTNRMPVLAQDVARALDHWRPRGWSDSDLRALKSVRATVRDWVVKAEPQTPYTATTIGALGGGPIPIFVRSSGSVRATVRDWVVKAEPQTPYTATRLLRSTALLAVGRTAGNHRCRHGLGSAERGILGDGSQRPPGTDLAGKHPGCLANRGTNGLPRRMARPAAAGGPDGRCRPL